MAIMAPPSTIVLSSFLSDAVSHGDVPGVVVLVTTPDRVIYHEAFGKMNVAQGVEMRKDAIFRIASMTKALTSAGVMMLVEEGRLGLDDEVGKYLPAFRDKQVISRLDLAAGTYETRPARHAITIRQLLTHTSGIGYSWSDPGLAMIEKLTGKTSTAELPLVHEPGEKWTYGAGPRVLGEVIEKIAGLGIEVFLKTRIFQPLGMPDTGYSIAVAKRERVVTQHQHKDGGITEIPNPETIAGPPRGDGGLLSTAADYSRFVQMMLNRGQLGSVRLLKPETVREMGVNHTGEVKVRLQPSSKPDFSNPFPLGAGDDVWGLGFQVATMQRPGSMSWAGIHNTFFRIDPKEELGIIILMQTLPFYNEAALRVLQGVETRVYEGSL